MRPSMTKWNFIGFVILLNRVFRIFKYVLFLIKQNKTSMPSMIHSARPTVAITMLTWNLFCLAMTEGRTDTNCQNSDHFRPWLWVSLVDGYYFHTWCPSIRKTCYSAKQNTWQRYMGGEGGWFTKFVGLVLLYFKVLKTDFITESKFREPLRKCEYFSLI